MHLTFHRSIFWAHLVSGILAGIIILSMAISGLMISFETQIMDWFNRGLNVTAPAAGTEPLSPEALVAKFKEQKPGLAPSGITWKGDATRPAVLSIGREGHFYVNPYTGEFLGEGNKEVHDLFHAITAWHRFLTGSGLERETGKAITGAGTLIFGVLLLSGIYLWFPRRWRWPNIRAVTLFNRRLSGRARDWNWHNVIGFWSALPMLLIILTGLIMSYTWANNLLYRATGNEPPPPRTRGPGGPGGPGAGMAQRAEGGERGPRGEGGERGPRGEGGERGPRGEGGERGPRSEGGERGPRSEGGERGPRGEGGERGPRGEGGERGPRGEGGPAAASVSLAGLDSLIAQIRKENPDFVSLSLRMPQQPGAPFPVMLDKGGRGEVHLRTMLNLDVAQQTVQRSPENLSDQNLGRRLRMYSRYLHTGELFGLPGQVVAALSTLAAILLVWTGFALAWRRFFKRRSKAAS
ncbi:MAG TPA: PepSY-associated TM helix domain-containing protein [Prosthecobacter sp.]